MAMPPATISVQSTANPNRRPAASTTRRAAWTTSGPTPSPGIVTIRYVVMPPSTVMRHTPSEVGGGAPATPSARGFAIGPRIRPPSWEAFAGAEAREGHVDPIDLGPVELVGRHEVGVQRRF